MSQKTKQNFEIFSSSGGSIYWSPGDAKEPILGEEKSNILLVPVEEDVVFPFLNSSLTFKSISTIKALKNARNNNEILFLFVPGEDFPVFNQLVTDIHVAGATGVFARILELSDNPDGSVNVSLSVGPQGHINALTHQTEDSRNELRVDASIILPLLIAPVPEEFNKESRLDELYKGLIEYLPPQSREQLNNILSEIPARTIQRLSFMIQNSPLNLDQKYSLLLELSLTQRRDFFITYLEEESKNMATRAELHHKTAADINQRQREEFLRVQMQQIKNELGESDEAEFDELRIRASEKEWPEQVSRRFEKELRKLSRFNPTTPDYAVQYTYLDTFLGLPWNHCDSSDFTLENVERVLDKEHFGLEKVKERIIEQMAVMKLRKDTKSPILCLYGPPGVGKTSLGKSIAEALGRKYVRVALGGLHDEAELRGHRRTYLGSMPGRIISALEKAGTSDPVMVLDEVDKIGQDYKGDPEQALLEVLDPEQNCKFHDNYLDEDYDLSKVLFIATANSIQKLSPPLLDRMELIEISGYAEPEKVEIALRHLIPGDLKELGIGEQEIEFSKDAILKIIREYTHESGVRTLEKKILQLLRKIARRKVSDQDFPTTIDPETVESYLGKPESFIQKYEGNDIPGIVTGLAWTQAGGEILFIESSIAPGKEGKLVLTGNLGDVMKESAMIALQFIKSNYRELNIPREALEFGTVHIHVPEGAVPKDGPSAGITILTSLASSFTGLKVRSNLAMTGEITLRGKVLPVGGIKEKILAAKRAGIKTIMLSSRNRKDIEEINSEYLEGLDFKYVDRVEEVLEFSLLK